MRVLVTAASRHGATQGIADAIAAGLRESGVDADVRAPAEVSTLDGYDGVVLGSAVYAGHWLEDARRFAERHEAALAGLPVWLFSSGPLEDSEPSPDASADARWEPTDIPRLFEETLAREHRVFPGRLETADMGIATRVLMRVMHQAAGDHRPWASIHDWAAAIAQDLGVGRAAVEA